MRKDYPGAPLAQLGWLLSHSAAGSGAGRDSDDRVRYDGSGNSAGTRGGDGAADATAPMR